MTRYRSTNPLIDSFTMPNFTDSGGPLDTTDWTELSPPNVGKLKSPEQADEEVGKLKSPEKADEAVGRAIPEASQRDGCLMDFRSKLEALIHAPGRKHLIRLDPGLKKKAIWFKHDRKRHITKAIRRMMMKRMPTACLQYRRLPPTTQEDWFLTFAEEFHWKPRITTVVEKEFEAQAAYTYSKIMCEWKKKWGRKKKAFRGIKSGVWRGLKKLWRSKKARKISETNSSNSKGGGYPTALKPGTMQEIRLDELSEDRDMCISRIEFLERNFAILKAEVIKLRAESNHVEDSDSTQAP